MTYKHTKFQDSAVMRSLEKLAVQKGLVTPEPMTKVATATIMDLTPSASLTQNIIKLCSGLRLQGLNTYADELEVHLLNYKRAQTLYETSPEKGEDLVEFAHPEGSHKLENVEGDEAVVEDILDRQLKMLEVVNKKPTGKLSSKAAINAVRQVFAQDAASQKLQEQIAKYAGQINNLLAVIDATASKELTFSLANYKDQIGELLTDPTIDHLKEVSKTLNRLHYRLDPSSWFHYMALGTTGLSEDTWAQIEPLIAKAQKYVSQALMLRTKYTSIAIPDEETMPPEDASVTETADPLVSQYQGLINLVNKNIAKLNTANVAGKDKILPWLSKALPELNEKLVALKSSSYKSDPAVKQQFQEYYNKTNVQLQRVDQYVNKA